MKKLSLLILLASTHAFAQQRTEPVVLAVDVVRTAPSDAPMVQATFDVAPPVNWTSPSPRDRFTTNEAAEEIRSADARQ